MVVFRRCVFITRESFQPTCILIPLRHLHCSECDLMKYSQENEHYTQYSIAIFLQLISMNVIAC